MANCVVCKRKLVNDEISVTKKLLGMGESSFYCRACLADKFHVDVATIDRKIAQYRALGCWLFAENGDENTEETS